MPGLLTFWIPLGVYLFALSFLLRRGSSTRAGDRLWATYLAACVLTTLALQWSPRDLKVYIVQTLFKPLETWLLIKTIAEYQGLPKPFQGARLASVLPLLPWFIVGMTRPDGLLGYGFVTFHILLFTQLGFCFWAIVGLSSSDIPVLEQSSFWISAPMLVNAATTLLIYLWNDSLRLHHPNWLQPVHNARSILVCLLYALFPIAFKCPYPTHSSS